MKCDECNGQIVAILFCNNCKKQYTTKTENKIVKIEKLKAEAKEVEGRVR